MITRKDFVRQSGLLAAGLAGGAISALQAKVDTLDPLKPSGPVYFATGCRVGEVSQDSALIWTRLTAEAERRWDGILPAPLMSPTRVVSPSPDIPASAWEGAVPGTAGEIRLRVSTSPLVGPEATETAWSAVDTTTDYSTQFPLSGLTPGTRYYYVAEGRNGTDAPVTRSPVGTFQTAPKPEDWENVWFAVITCQMYYQRDEREGFRLYRSLANLSPLFLDHPAFIVRTGDNVYYDRDNPRGNTLDLCRLHWQRMFSLPLLRDFFRQVPSYWQQDDHDVFFDDAHPQLQAPWIKPLTFEQGAQIFREQTPVGEKLFRTFRWGRGLQVWLPESRDFRSPDDMPDGPAKTIWGAEQKAWLKQSLLASDATFKIIVSPTPIVGPDNADQADNHSNKAYQHEGDEFRHWVRDQGLTNLYVIAGDRHWQYLSTDPRTSLREFACGPASDAMVLKGPGYDPNYHSFYRQGGGFVTVSFRKGTKKVLANPQRVVTEEGVPMLTIRIHDVEGRVLHEYRDVATA
jgi:alkaline phosphatase D